MPSLVFSAPGSFEAAFANLRRELDIPTSFPFEVVAEADGARLDGHLGPIDRSDARHLPFVAIDPPGATDLDQAFYAEQVAGGGFRVFYAIADPAAFISPGGALDTEARQRGTTLYSPDDRCPLHPRILSEDRASLLPGDDKPALLWTIHLDADAQPTNWHLKRASVHVADAISYADAQRSIEAGTDDTLNLLATIGKLRQVAEAERGGVSLSLPPQEIVESDGLYHLEFGRSLPVEGWNAQISLLTGMVAATTMVQAGVGLLRTLPPPDPAEVERLRLTANALGLDWAAGDSYPSFVRGLRADSPEASAFLVQCTRVFRGAGYLGFNTRAGVAASQDPGEAVHGAIASVYSHVTAPLRRLVDRFSNEILLALYADQPPPAWAVEALDELPSLMGRARQRESSLESAMVDLTEAIVLSESVGKTFDGVVVDVKQERGVAIVQIPSPAVVASVEATGRRLAEPVRLRLERADIETRTVEFSVQP